MEEFGNRLPPNLVLDSTELDGSQMNEPFIRLLTRQIDSLTIDSFVIAAVDEIVAGDATTPDTVLCTADDNSRHAFRFYPVVGSPVAHHFSDAVEGVS